MFLGFFQTDRKAEIIFKVFMLLFADSHIGQMNFPLSSIRQLYKREKLWFIINYCLKYLYLICLTYLTQ